MAQGGWSRGQIHIIETNLKAHRYVEPAGDTPICAAEDPESALYLVPTPSEPQFASSTEKLVPSGRHSYLHPNRF